MKCELDIVEIEWEGPLLMEGIEKLNDSWDYGIYQIYGTHPIFGSDSLLYIGKAQENSFAGRIPAHREWVEWESTPVDIYVGRLGGTEKMLDETKWAKWNEMIERAEKLLIFFEGRSEKAPETFTQKMRRKIDSIRGRLIYNRRLGTAEPPFAHIRHALGLSRFTLRGKRKVDIQWKLYCIVHNLTKVHRYGEGFA